MLSTLVSRMNPSAPSKPPIVYHHQYDRVHDSYGPGVFLGWIFLTYSIAAHFGGPRERRRSMDLLDKDLVIALAYPIASSFYMLSQYAHYPGPKDKLWNWEKPEEEFVQYAAAIWAPAQACLYSISVCLILTLFLCSNEEGRERNVACEKRGLLVFATSVWVFIALIVVNSHDGYHFGLVVGGIVGLAAVFGISAALVWFLAARFAAGVALLCVVTTWLFQGYIGKFLGGVIGMFCKSILIGIFMVFPIVGLLYTYAFWLAFPRTDHSILDYGQATALAFGSVNLIFALYGLWQENGTAFWAEALQEAGYEGKLPVVRSRYQRVPNEGAAESDVEMAQISQEQEHIGPVSRRATSASEA